jgi:hypothetical protein
VTTSPEVLYQAQTPIGFQVRVTKARWELIVREKHPVMAGEEDAIRSALELPDQVRQSRQDGSVYLFYKSQEPKRWLCAVAKREGDEGFLITAYPTDAIKEGTRIWPN